MTTTHSVRRRAGFTLVEVMVSMALGLIVMTGVLSTFIYLGRSLGRLANQQNIEAEGRRAVQMFAQDVRIASDVTSVTTSGNLAVTLRIPTSTSTSDVTYTYNATTGVFTRAVSGGSTLTLASNLVAFDLKYYDIYDVEISTSIDSRRRSIKKISLSFGSQAGTTAAGTRTPIHRVATGNILLRNKTGYE